MGTRDVPLKFREPSISREGDPLHIFGTGEARKICKTISEKCEVVTLFLHTFRILGPLPISGTVEARNFNNVQKSIQIE